jgi:hypothetical protein
MHFDTTDGPTVPIPRDYHQKITQAFRENWPYAPQGPTPLPDAAQLLDILLTVYELYPIILVPLL